MDNKKNFNDYVIKKKLVIKYREKTIQSASLFLLDVTELIGIFSDLKKLMESYKQAIFQNLMILPVKVILKFLEKIRKIKDTSFSFLALKYLYRNISLNYPWVTIVPQSGKFRRLYQMG